MEFNYFSISRYKAKKSQQKNEINYAKKARNFTLYILDSVASYKTTTTLLRHT